VVKTIPDHHASSSALEVKGEIRLTVGDAELTNHLRVTAIAEPLSIGEVARRCGVATSALRFYEDRGLIRSLRTSGGHRTYERSVIRRVAFIVFAQRVGLTLAEVGEALGQLPENRVPRRADWAKLSASWTARIDERIADLERLKAGLTECIGCGCLSLGRCKLANPNDWAGSLGPGPRYLLR
jgi:MerR family redox-sensitive transcriptional activator SoxR